MFKNREIRVQMVKNGTVPPPPKPELPNYETIDKIIKEQLTNLAIGGVGVYAAITVIKTASTIAINAAPKR